MFFDSHAHLTAPPLLDDLDLVLARAEKEGVGNIINIATDLASLEEGLKLRERVPWVHQTAAIHPHDAHLDSLAYKEKIAASAQARLLVAIGETGLDYFYRHAEPKVQQRVLKEHLQLALETDLPVIIHCREAFKDLLNLLDSEYRVEGGGYGRGVLHCFTGALEEARKLLDLGWYISLSGILTFKKSEELRKIAAFIPLDRILIETDAPYLAPEGHRGKRNEPAFVVEVAKVLASIKKLSLEKIKEQTSLNAKHFIC